MPIDDPTPTPTAAPVLSRRAIGQKFRGVTCLMPESRDRTKSDSNGNTTPLLKPNGRPKQELVVTMMTIKSTMPTGKIDEPRIPAEGEIVRAILKGKAYGDWIDASKELGRKIGVGFIVEMDTTIAQAYDEHGQPQGPEMTTQEQADAVPRGRSLGFYGPLTVRVPEGAEEVAWDTKACQFYNDSQRPDAAVATAQPVEDLF
jgi:hypothetical protein